MDIPHPSKLVSNCIPLFPHSQQLSNGVPLGVPGAVGGVVDVARLACSAHSVRCGLRLATMIAFSAAPKYWLLNIITYHRDVLRDWANLALYRDVWRGVVSRC